MFLDVSVTQLIDDESLGSWTSAQNEFGPDKTSDSSDCPDFDSLQELFEEDSLLVLPPLLRVSPVEFPERGTVVVFVLGLFPTATTIGGVCGFRSPFVGVFAEESRQKASCLGACSCQHNYSVVCSVFCVMCCVVFSPSVCPAGVCQCVSVFFFLFFSSSFF